MTLGGAELCGVHLVPYTDAKIPISRRRSECCSYLHRSTQHVLIRAPTRSTHCPVLCMRRVFSVFRLGVSAFCA